MPEGHFEIVGYGEAPSRCMNRGGVVNIEQTTQAIKRVVENAEHMANCRAQSVYVGISGTHIRSLNSTGVVAVRDGRVWDRDVDSRSAQRRVGIESVQTCRSRCSTI